MPKQPKQPKQPKPTVEEIIRRTIAAQGIVGERQRQSQDAFKATEKRLYAYPVICMKVESDLDQIEEIKAHGPKEYSKSIVMYQTSGCRLSGDELAGALIQDITARIAEEERELDTIEKALGVIAGDPYSRIVNYKYFESKRDDEIAKLLSCDASTVRRNKSRLVRRLAVFLYGSAAV